MKLQPLHFVLFLFDIFVVIKDLNILIQKFCFEIHQYELSVQKMFLYFRLTYLMYTQKTNNFRMAQEQSLKDKIIHGFYDSVQ